MNSGLYRTRIALIVLMSKLVTFQVVFGQDAASHIDVKVEQEVPVRVLELFRMLDHPHAQREIGLSEAQIAAVAKIKEDSDISEILRANIGKPKSAETAAMIKEKSTLKEKSIEELLTPHQFTRLKQLCLRMEIAAIGLPEALTNGRLAGPLGIDQSQAIVLKVEASKILDDLEQKLKELNEKAESSILSELAPEQQGRMQEALGEYFQYHLRSIQKTLIELEFRHNQKLLNDVKRGE